MGDIARYRNDTYPIYATVLREDGSVMPIDGNVFVLTVNETANPINVTNQVFQSDGVIVGDGSTGRVMFPVPGTTEPGKFFFDIQMTDVQGYRRTIEKGRYRLFQDITKNKTLAVVITAKAGINGDLVVT